MTRLLGAAISCAALALSAQADTPHEREYLEANLGVWSTQDQSSDSAYDWVGSQKWRVLPSEESGVWVYQENTIYGSNSQSEIQPSPQPYFQVAVHFQDLGNGLLHTTTYRVADRPSARAFATGQIPEFDKSWLGQIACMGRMQRVSKGFWNGSATCPNGYRGGVKVESRSIFAPDYFVNWDRGFDASGALIWGPDEGGYIFKKVENSQ